MATTSMTVELKDGQEVDVEIVYNIWGEYHRATMEDPEEWPECEIEKITLCGMDITGIINTPMETIEESCFEDQAGRAEAAMEDYYDRKEGR